MLALNPAGVDTLMNIYHFYKQTHQGDEQANEAAILDGIFKEYQSTSPGNLSSEELDILKEHLPIEMLIK